MPRTNINPITPLGPFPTLPVAANALDFLFVAADVANGNEISFTGRNLLLVRNVNAGAQTFTITSAPFFNRTGDITNYSLATGEFAVFNLFGGGALDGWRQSTGKLFLNGSHADIQFALISIP